MLRYASPNERRTISREDLGFYHAVVVSATYEFDNALDVTAPTSFHAPIAHCIAQHPFLSVLVKDRHTDKAYYQRAPHVDLSQHLAILPPVVDTAKQSAIQALLASELDRPFDHAIPPWRVLVTPLINTPLRDTPGETTSCILTFSFSHSILDGPSGISFLLSPLLGAILPSFLTSRLNIAPQAVVLSEKTWTGTPCAFVPGTTRSKVAVRVIDAETVARALATARGRGVKLTGVMHALVGRGLRAALGDEGAELVAVTAVDLRAAVGRAAGEMGEFAAGEYTAFPPSGGEAGGLTEGEWEGAGRVTGQLGEARGRLRDQAVGLLRFLPSVRGWLRGKVGGRRDCSYEVSNLGGVDFGEGRGGRVVEAVFAQPGMVVSCPVCVNVVSVKGWRLVYTVTWATGALGVGEDEEDAFVERVYEVVDDGFRGL
ncbi:hypothetical protein QBC39DRAFT_93362 [Podospora conica]|nr:hypothetical protein QBC39DRAFT_93362 [Schizothecium conicum]